MNSGNALVIPIQISSRYQPQATGSKGPLYRFQQLPYSGTNGDINPDTPYLASSIKTAPFSNQASFLEMGVHLHFHLPAPLCAALPNAPTTGPRPFYPVPNRWLIQKTYADNVSELLVVESDYFSATASTSAVPYPIPAGFSLTGAEDKPFGWLGRVLPFNDWQSEKNHPNPDSQYLPQLTSVGYGDATFASYYPSCFGVFGYFDEGAIPLSSQPIRYRVVGWYEDVEQDFLKQWLNANNPNDTNDIDLSAMLTQLGWQASGQIPTSPISLYFGETTLNGSLPTTPSVSTLSAGLSTTDAFVASLPQKDQTSAAQTLWLGSAQNAQAEAALLQSWQSVSWAKQFEASSGCAQWQVLPATSQFDNQPVPEALYSALVALNQAEIDLFQISNQLQAAQNQLYTDWCLYMTCAYPPEGEDALYPNLNEVLAWTQKEPLANLNNTLFPQVQEAINAWETAQTAFSSALAAANQSSTIFQVKQVPGPRFYQPRDPVIQLAFDNAGSSDLTNSEGELNCLWLSSTQLPSANGANWQPTSLLDSLTSTTLPTQLASFDSQACIPTLLEWQTDLVPPTDDTTGGTFNPNYFEGRLAISGDSAAAAPNNFKFSSSSSSYQGITPLNLNTPLINHFEQTIGITSTSSQQYYGQALSSFNDSLLMLERVDQLKVKDPLGFAFFQDFTNTVASALQQSYTVPAVTLNGATLPERTVGGISTGLAPLLEAQFNPIRMGIAQLSALNWVDQFGLSYSVDTSQLQISSALTVPSSVSDLDQDPLPTASLWLAPAITQATRLNFCYLNQSNLSASGPLLPSQTPKQADASQLDVALTANNQNLVYGWLMADNLNQEMLYYNAEGSFLARRSGPGDASLSGSLSQAPALLAIDQFLSAQSSLTDFLNVLELAQQSICPSNSLAESALALLSSNPIAVVQTAVEYQLLQPAATAQQWPDSTASPTPDADFTQVNLPFTLGESQNLEDGLLGYWQIEATSGTSLSLSSTFHSPQVSADRLLDDQIPPVSASINIARTCFWTNLTAPAQVFLMLVDPRAPLHANCGLLPTTQIQMANQDFLNGLSQIRPTFQIGPILSTSSPVQLSLPNEPGLNWQWQSISDNSSSTPIQANSSQAQFYDKLQWLSGTLTLTSDSDQS